MDLSCSGFNILRAGASLLVLEVDEGGVGLLALALHAVDGPRYGPDAVIGVPVIPNEGGVSKGDTGLNSWSCQAALLQSTGHQFSLLTINIHLHNFGLIYFPPKLDFYTLDTH